MSHRIQSMEDTISSSNEEEEDQENGITSNEEVETKSLGERFAIFSQLYQPRIRIPKVWISSHNVQITLIIPLNNRLCTFSEKSK